MKRRVILLLNLAILVVNFVVSLGATETQILVARSAVRAVYDEPLVRPAPPPEDPRAPSVRLVKYLARLKELDRLTPEQIEALYLAHEYCWSEYSIGGEQLFASAIDGASTRLLLGDLRERVSRNVAATLKAADVPEGDLLSRLVRVVLASAG